MLYFARVTNCIRGYLSESFKEYRRQFELILEGEKQLDVTRQKLAGAESRERKIRKDLEKAARKSVKTQ